jgi:hypothetical protein
LRHTNLAIAVGVIGWVCLVLYVLGARVEYHLTLRVSELPPNDEKLRNWFQEQPRVEDLQVKRQGNAIEISYSRIDRMGHDHYLSPPLLELGYGQLASLNHRTTTPSLFTRLGEILGRPIHLGALAACIAASLGLFWGLSRLLSRREEPVG